MLGVPKMSSMEAAMSLTLSSALLRTEEGSKLLWYVIKLSCGIGACVNPCAGGLGLANGDLCRLWTGVMGVPVSVCCQRPCLMLAKFDHVVVGDNESEILKMVNELAKK